MQCVYGYLLYGFINSYSNYSYEEMKKKIVIQKMLTIYRVINSRYEFLKICTLVQAKISIKYF